MLRLGIVGGSQGNANCSADRTARVGACRIAGTCPMAAVAATRPAIIGDVKRNRPEDARKVISVSMENSKGTAGCRDIALRSYRQTRPPRWRQLATTLIFSTPFHA